jgi:putative pyruvate formate lyase activating enzyme
VNFVGGEPTPQIPFILKILQYVKSDLPIVWNSNLYLSLKGMNLLKGVVDVYLSDFKYGNDKCAERLSAVKNYTEIVKRNHLIAIENAELVIRHLVLPSHMECCSKPIFDWIAENLKDKAIVNIMNQYRPEYEAFKHKEINRYLRRDEFYKVVEYAKKLNLNFIT